MKKIYFIPFIVILTLINSLIFIACEKEKDLNTNQLESGEITLKSFGPSPAMRGGELRFIGTNLDKVISIVIPGVAPITEISKTSKFEIRVIIPQTAEPGIIELNIPNGKLSTITPIGFLEPISIESFEPKTVKSGQTLKINGEYLNIVEEVILPDGVHILKKDFVSQVRKSIEVVIPAESQSGKIIVSNGADILTDGEEIPIWIYSEEELNVVLPTISSITPNPVKAGTALSIKGADLDLVNLVIFPGGDSVITFASHSDKEIALNAPLTSQDGKVVLVPTSGVHVESSSDLVMVDPTVSISPLEVKNRDTITVTGTNLDLITNVTFGGGGEGTIIEGGSATSLMVVVPDLAITGEVKFKTTSGKTVSGSSLTLSSATITDFTPNSDKPGNDVIFTGTNLDIINEVLFTGDVTGRISAQSETSLTVTIPVGAKNGTITLIALNQETVTTATEIEVLVNLPNFTKYIEKKGTPGGKLTLTGTNMELVKEIIFPGDITATAYGLKSDTLVEVYVPVNVTLGYGALQVITYDGDQGLLPEVFFGSTDPITEETIIVMDYEEHDGHNGDWDNGWSGGTEIIHDVDNSYILVNVTVNGWILNCNHQADGAPAPVINNIENYDLKFDIKIDEGTTGADAAQLQFVFADQWNYWYGANLFPSSTEGDWVTITVPVSTWGLTGTFDLSSGANGLYGGDVPAGVSLDNLRFDPR